MTVKKINYNCTCNECNKSNYEGSLAKKQVDTVFEMQIGSMGIRICKDCLTLLVGAAVVALNDK